MNGKIKTKFAALFAVALMITVCVVPVVGNEDVQAASSSDVGYNEITVSGAVYDGGKTALNGVKVTVSAGTLSGASLTPAYTTSIFTDSQGKYSAKLYYDGTSTDVQISIDVASEKFNAGQTDEYKNPAYGVFTTSDNTLTFDGVTKNISNANLYAGKVTFTGKTYYGNANEVYSNADGFEIALYTVNADGTTFTKSTEYVTEEVGGKYSLTIPVSALAGKYKIGATFADDDIVYSAEMTSAVSKVLNFSSSKTFIFKVNATSFAANDTITFTGGGKYSGASVEITEKGEVVGVFTYDSTATGDDKFTPSKPSYGSIAVSNLPVTTGVTTYTYNATNMISGSVYMEKSNNKVPVSDSVTITAYYQNGTNTPVSLGTAPTKDGKYLITYTSESAPEFDKVYLTTSINSDVKYEISNFQFGTAKVKDISIDSTGYEYVSGIVSGIGNKGIKGVGVTIGVTEYFGNNNLTTDDNGKYALMVKHGQTITITPNSAYKYDLVSAQIEVYGTITQNFKMDSKDIVFTVKDKISNKGLQGAKVYYSLDYDSNKKSEATWSNALATDEDGNVKITVNYNESAVWYATYDGRSFSVNKDAPSSSNTIETDDNLYEVNFTLNSKAFDYKGIDLPQVVIVNGSAYVLGPALMVSESVGTAYFYAKEPASPAEYKLFFDDCMFGDYYVTAELISLEELTNNKSTTPVTLAQNSITGYVTQADGGYNSTTGVTKGIPGMIVKAYDASGDLVAETVTKQDGSYYQAIIGKITVDRTEISAPEGSPYTGFRQDTTQQTVNLYKAAEQTYSGTVKDLNGNPIVNQDITVKAVDAEGKTVGSVAQVDEYGNYEIITSISTTKATKIIASDSSGKYTFADVEGTLTSSSFNLVAQQATYVVTVVDGYNVPIVGAAVEIVSGNAADGYVTVVGDIVTDKDGVVKAFLSIPEDGDVYMAKVTSFGMDLSIDAKGFGTDYEVTLSSYIKLRQVTLQDAAGQQIKEAGYIVKVLDDKTDDIVGQVTTDSNGIVTFYSGENAIKYEIQSPEGSPYTFGTVSPMTEDLTLKRVKWTVSAEQTLYSGRVQSLNDVRLEGVTVSLLNGDKEIVGSGVTDENGLYEIVAINANTAIASDAELDIGKFTFNEAGVSLSDSNSFNTIESYENLYSGYYADGAVIKDVEVSYMDSGVKSLAKVIDNKYYIVTKTNLPSTTEVTATAPNFNAKGTITAANAPLTVGDVPTYDAYFMPSMGAQILGPYNDVVYGTVLTLVAQNEYSIGVPEEDGVIQKYKFAGWYVNGDKVSDDLVTTYTVNGDCTIYADYKVSSYVAAPADESNGLSMDVLVLGIVIVVLGLLAFAYAVKFKKE